MLDFLGLPLPLSDFRRLEKCVQEGAGVWMAEEEDVEAEEMVVRVVAAAV